MARQRTKAEDIRNPEHYFNKYIAMEVKHNQSKQKEIEDNECSLEEKCEFESFGYNVAVNKNGELFDSVLLDNTEFAWIERIQNPQLYEAMQALSYEQKKLLTLIYAEQLPQQRVAEILGITQQGVLSRLATIKKRIKYFFAHPC